MSLPLAHHVGRAGARSTWITPHAEDDLFGERDPDLLVVHELVVVLERLDRVSACVRVQSRIEREAVTLADPAVPLRPELRPGSKQREIDVEQHRREHRSRIAPPAQ